jgi:uncharacterized protein YqgV (UPF0045/DUF77 family)
MQARAEFTVEPFVDGNPGPHVLAAVDAVREYGLDPQIGPFATIVEGDAVHITDALLSMLTAARRTGATRVSLQVDFEG